MKSCRYAGRKRFPVCSECQSDGEKCILYGLYENEELKKEIESLKDELDKVEEENEELREDLGKKRIGG